jgi:hypothetical protein
MSMQQLLIRSATTCKPGESESKNEDAILVNKDNRIFAIADGAGGAGLFCRQWADFIISNIPDHPITNEIDFTNWFNKLREDYNNQKKAETKIQFPELTEKYSTEGSLCTLVVLWIVNKKTYMMSCGDSALFLFTNKKYFCNLSYPSFMQRPNLLSSIKEYPSGKVFFKQEIFYPKQYYILCSDAIAQYIYCSYLYANSHTAENQKILQTVKDDYEFLSQFTIDLGKKNYHQKNFKQDILLPLFNACINNETFKTYTASLNNSEELPYDDYTIIIIN